MRTSMLIAVCLFAFPALAESHCAANDQKGESVIAVSVTGDFRSCLMKLMEGAKTKCPAGAQELKLSVTGSENGKVADLRVLRVDCPGGGDGGTVNRPVPPAKAEPAKTEPAKAKPAKK
jgi:hypothetical protein